MLRYFLLFTIFYFIYRLFLRPIVKKILQPLKGPAPKRNFSKSARQSNPPTIETMQKCPTCETYNPISSAILFEGKYFCNEQCRNSFTGK